MDSSLSPYPNEVKQIGNWKPKLAPNPLQHLVPLQIFRPTYGPKILQEIPTIEVVCAHLTVCIYQNSKLISYSLALVHLIHS